MRSLLLIDKTRLILIILMYLRDNTQLPGFFGLDRVLVSLIASFSDNLQLWCISPLHGNSLAPDRWNLWCELKAE